VKTVKDLAQSRCIEEPKARRRPCLVVVSQFEELEKRKLMAAQAWVEEANRDRRLEYQHMEERRRVWYQ